MLNLPGRAVTDAGLECVAELDTVVRLYLDDTHVTNKGLVHLKSMSVLSFLSLLCGVPAYLAAGHYPR
jgi:hypothetical protein